MKGMLESKINEEMIKITKEAIGRGAEAAKTRICEDMIIVRLSKSLTHEERQIISTAEGKRLVKELRQLLDEILKPKFTEMIMRLTGCQVVGIYRDINPEKGEYVYLFILDKNLEEDLKSR
ncbi:uncharacterized protein YbcI [Caldanaerobacter subterraneus subsp. tengcongensis MB4]|uniref:Na+-translocating membrane potential-generating system MpsC domain-containing protein n=2 Tax=Caldanaerobacter subterraneus TaxID=911092 RepID=Q8RC21_CALS4|nr:DUF2294 domain-containing protein [Caldanaerobacter subterraneus]AAM23898.1 conserved hypothetical protein [Caldanaerobacter subterraneus subsp. tengcongensis MB4]MCS3916596.1 uncharacterized protein YbcI [Caldanaerobacter subterraneus subsp. tengcongensis MB4]NNG67687.1 DUF2294 domain-containing protein [Caldanaerobacter subterraneus]